MRVVSGIGDGMGGIVDDQRFDNLARSMAHGLSRRGVVRGLTVGVVTVAVGALRGRGAGAQETLLPVGSACTQSGECQQGVYGEVVICADNGVTADPALTCCLVDGECGCGEDAACCGAARCRPTGDGYCSGICTTEEFGTLPPGSPCAATEECFQGYGGPQICGDNGIAEDGSLTCCREVGGLCGTNAACCGALLCNSGTCGGAVPTGETRTVLTDLNLRTGPSTADHIILVMPAGSTVTRIGEDTANGFVFVEYQGTRGWAFAEYLG